MTIPTFPLPIDTTPEDVNIYLGLSRQDLKSHQAICELVDNAISATPEGDFFIVEIHIEKDGEDVFIKVADDGIGISLDDIQNRILKIGGRGSNIGKLNEHGFGLKNSLCVLTGNQKEFCIFTKDEQAVQNNLVYKVEGPFRNNMEVLKGTDTDMDENVFKCRPRTGTRVLAKTTMLYFGTMYRPATRLNTIIERFLEHLGIIYRGYLTDPRNEIWIRWRDVTNGMVNWNDDKVVPIKIPYLRAEEDPITIKINGNNYKVTYKRGGLDTSVIKDAGLDRPYPLKIYYQGNQKTQGVDVTVRGRVILTHQLDYLWPDIRRHNDFNRFVGELIIDDDVFSTVNNKTQLDPNSPAWEKLLDVLNEDKFKPPRRTIASFTEKEIQKKLLHKLPSIVSGSTAQGDFPTWPGLGVKIDVLHRLSGKDEVIYELKIGRAGPLDVYQLVMYWDGRVEDGVRPTLGRLVATIDANQNILELITYWNSRKDKGGQNYNLEFKKTEDLIELIP